MSPSDWAIVVLLFAAGVVFLSTYPYLVTAFQYRQRDNGLAYILFVMGVGVWSGFFIGQAIDPDGLIKGFFFALATVGATLAAVGWFLFASTASSTPVLPRIRLIYGGIGFLAGLNITFIVTTFTHSLYWSIPTSGPVPSRFAEIDPNIGYIIHTVFIAGLFLAGAAMFFSAWRSKVDTEYTLLYVAAASILSIAVVISNLAFVGGASLAPIVAGCITTVGWLQAREKLGSGSPTGRITQTLSLR